MDVLRCKKYESIIIFTDKLTEESYNKTVNIYESKLRGVPADIINIDKLGHKRLAYPVKDCTSGWYLLVHFRCEPEGLREFERMLRVDDYVLKYLTNPIDEDREYSDLGSILEDAMIDDKSEQSSSPGTTPGATGPVDVFDLIFGGEDETKSEPRVIKTPALASITKEEIEQLYQTLQEADSWFSQYCDLADVYVPDDDELDQLKEDGDDDYEEALELREYSDKLQNAFKIIERLR